MKPVPKTYLFDGAEMMAYVREQLRPYLGIGADIVSVHQMLGGMIDIVIYGRPIKYPFSPTIQLSDLGIPSDRAKIIIEEICSTLNVVFANCIGNINPCFVYEWEIEELTQALTIREVERNVQPIPPPNVDIVEVARTQAQHILEDGGWISEKMKRNLGI